MNKPNFFIVGSARSGTTSLWQILRRHPQVFMPADELYKEPGFFSDLRGLTDIGAYLGIFSDASPEHEWAGEASTAYLTDQASAKRIYDYNPDAKIIIMLRNPSERAHSLYNWMVQDGYEYAGTFQEALDLERIRIDKQIPNWFEPEYYWNYMYFQSGLYYKQVRRYKEYFNENVMIIKFELFKQDPLSVCADVCRFLGIKSDIIHASAYNASRRVISPRIQFTLRNIINDLSENKEIILKTSDNEYFTNKYYEYAHKLSAVAPFSYRDKLWGIYILHKVNSLLKNASYRIAEINTKQHRDQLLQAGLTDKKPLALDSKLKVQLIAEYRPDIIRLSALTNIDFSDWFTR